MIMIAPDGSIEGGWSGQYYKKPKINFDIMSGGFEGKICPGMVYRDEKGDDPTKLYFIAKGKFLIAETDFDKNTLFHRSGDVYVRGCLNRDHSATGTVTITSDEKISEEFEWKAAGPSKSGILTLPGGVKN